jgi:hypothetical protein
MALSMAETAEKAQQEPHWPWFLTAVTLLSLWSTISLGAVGPEVDVAGATVVVGALVVVGAAVVVVGAVVTLPDSVIVIELPVSTTSAVHLPEAAWLASASDWMRANIFYSLKWSPFSLFSSDWS